ncbi:MAG: zinc-ribbon domain-containing protein [Terriglobia bacterium]
MKYCPNCGAEVAETHSFCARCGQKLSAAVTTAPAAPVRDYRRHVKLLAALLLLWGGLGLLKALAMIWVAGPLARFLGHRVGHVLPGGLLPGMLTSLAWVAFGLSVAAVAAGAGLLDYRGWARPLAIVVCVLALLSFPLGTLVGIYGLWVLISAEGERHYRKMAAPRR